MKKKVLYALTILLTLIPNIVLAADLEYVACGNSKGIPAPVPQLISIVYTLLIVATPIILIIFSIVALLKAITGGSQDEINKAKNKVIKKFISAALVFFVAGLVQFVVIRASDATEKQTVVDCIRCMLYNNGCMPSDGGEDAYQATTRPGESVPQESNPSGDNDETSSSNPREGNPDTDDDGDGVTYTSTRNNIKYYVYSQSDSRWRDEKYTDGTSDTMSNRGCMVTSTAVVASAYDSSINPKTIFHNGYRHVNPVNAIPKVTDGAFSCVNGSTSSSSIKENLRKGNIVVIKVWGPNRGEKNKYTKGQHFMALLDVSNDGTQIYVGTETNSKIGWFNEDVLVSVQQAIVCTPSQALIDKYN